MTDKTTHKSGIGGMIDRRKFLALSGMTASAFAMGYRPAAAQADKGEVTVVTWETYHEPDWVAEYTAQTGVKINVVRIGSVDEMYALARSGSVETDILVFDSGSIPRYIAAGLIAPTDASQLANLGNITPDLPWQEFNTLDTELWGVPYNWGTQPLIYNTELVEEPTSWAALWDQKWAGKVSLFDDAYITIPMVALYVGAADPYNLTEEEWGEVTEALRALRPQVRTIARGFDDAATIFGAGEAVIGYLQNVAVVTTLRSRGLPFAYTYPKEGTPTWIDNTVLTPAAQRPEVYAFIDYCLTIPWQSRMIMASLNNGVLSAEGAREGGVPEDVLVKTNILDQSTDGFWQKMSLLAPPEDIDRRVQLWNDFKAGVL